MSDDQARRLPAPVEDEEQEEPRETLPGLARIAAGAWLRTAEWSVVTSVRVSKRVAEAATSPTSALELAQQVAHTSGVVADLAKTVSAGTPLPQAVAEVGQQLRGSVNGTDPADTRPHTEAASVPPEQTPSLREQGRRLLERSRDVWDEDVGHPAYAQILTELAPDEARILLLLLREGPQPSVDVRTGGPTGLVASRLIASGLTTIGPRAGCRQLDRVPSYLHNLFRLGLVWFSREQVRDPMEYQVLEAQPDVVEAMQSMRMTRPVRRSIHLTPFGNDFCRASLIEDDSETADLPLHQSPDDQARS